MSIWKLKWLWDFIKSKLSNEGALNKTYDPDLDGKIADDQILNVDWTKILNKPSTFPPSSHQHDDADLLSIDWSKVLNKPSTYPPENHVHTRNEISDFFSSPFWTNIPDKPSVFPPESHVHGDSDLLSIDWSKILNKPSMFPPSAHNHSGDTLTPKNIVLSSGSKVVEIQGPNGSFVLSCQDGSGRLHIYWNAYFDGTKHRFIKAGDYAGWLLINSDGKLYYRRSTTAAANAGDVITWGEAVVLGDGKASDADKVDGMHADQIRDWNNILNKPSTFPPSAHQHDASDILGVVRNIGFKAVAELPTTPEDYEIVFYDNAPRFYDPNQGKWGRIQVSFGYNAFDNNGGGVWTRYLSIPITAVPSEYAQYKIVIDATNVTVYAADGTQKAQAAIASDFWANVKSDGRDIRVFDQGKYQLYFWVEEFDYVNQKAVIWTKLLAGSTELNVAYGNQSALESSYNNPDLVFEFFDDLEQDTVGAAPSKWTITNAGSTETPTVTDVIAYKGSKSIKSWQPNTGSPSHFYLAADISPPGNIVVELAFYVDGKLNTGSANNFNFGIGTAVDANNVFSINFYNVAQDVWHILKIFVDYGNNQYKYVLDGTDSGWNTFATATDPATGRYFVHVNDNYGGYIDVIKVYKLADPATFGVPVVKEF